jgi:hypothetical protein
LPGWAALFLIIYLVKRPLLFSTAALLGASWLPTASLALDCTALASTGWIIGRLNRSGPRIAVSLFAATLTFWDFNRVLAINVPWLLQLAGDALRDSRYLESFGNDLAIHLFLFGSLIVGALISEPPATLASLAGEGGSAARIAGRLRNG